ncbi:MAG: hypothetical protein M3083_19385 [Actinomycetota bacterium]|nr:hypothetical protein [Actinomycetota bacterium]
MFKRLFWLAIGASLGFSTSRWVTRTVKQKIEQYSPARLTADLAGKARAAGGRVRAALADGKEAMREQENLLRAQLEPRKPPTPR